MKRNDSPAQAQFTLSAATAEAEEPVDKTGTATPPPSPVSSRCSSQSILRHADSNDSLVQVGCLFDNEYPTKLEHFCWRQQDDQRTTVRVTVRHIDDEPGALQSGHYLWPAAKMLADYLIDTSAAAARQHQQLSHIESVLELGCGCCALPTLTALQAWQRSVQCLVVTDHDATVLQRAVDNYESTLEAILNAASSSSSTSSDGELNQAINCVGSIPVFFETLAWQQNWKDDDDEDRAAAASHGGCLQSIRQLVLEHTNSRSDTFDVVVGSDLIYCQSVVAPLLETASKLMNPTRGRFWLAQSFAYGQDIEEEINAVCQQLGLVRTILVENDDASRRIQQFRFLVEGDRGEVLHKDE